MEYSRQICLHLLMLSFASLLLGSPWWVSAAEEYPGARVADTSMPRPDELRRHALVIGNSAYQKGPLANPVNDARAMQDVLKGIGFDVIFLENASRAQMMEAIAQFGDRLQDGGVGLFYYAGHGIQLKGRNFLIPVDAAIGREEEVKYKGVDAGEVVDVLVSAKNPLNIIILNACRSNPFPRSSRSPEIGLASMDAPVGALIAFATGPNAVALDGQGKNGLYTEHLLRYITQPGLRVEDVFKRVRADVRQVTNNAQIPWESTSLEGDFYFVPAGPTQTSKGKPQPVDDKTLSLEFWSAIKNSSNVYDYQAYLSRFPTGEFAPLARQRVADLSRREPAADVPQRGADLAPEVKPALRVPTYHALIIANKNYRYLSKLETPLDDAREVEKVLREKYGFKNITVLRDATRVDITSALVQFRINLTFDDSLLIYYAGHGQVDRETERGYWLPVDANRNNEANWVSNDDITNYLKGMHARHVLIVSDSCYSGTLTRDESSQTKVGGEKEWLARKIQLRARTALTSGGLEPVKDKGGEGHSVFAKAFLDALRENDRPRAMDDMYPEIRHRVVLNAEQTPKYHDIRLAGHEDGDFVFVPSPYVPAALASPAEHASVSSPAAATKAVSGAGFVAALGSTTEGSRLLALQAMVRKGQVAGPLSPGETNAILKGMTGSSRARGIAELAPLISPGLTGRDGVTVLGTRNELNEGSRYEAIKALAAANRFGNNGADTRLLLEGTTGSTRARAIAELAPTLQGDLGGKDAAAILGNSRELNGGSRVQAIEALVSAKRLRTSLTGDEIALILEGTTGSSRARALAAISTAH